MYSIAKPLFLLLIVRYFQVQKFLFVDCKIFPSAKTQKQLDRKYKSEFKLQKSIDNATQKITKQNQKCKFFQLQKPLFCVNFNMFSSAKTLKNSPNVSSAKALVFVVKFAKVLYNDCMFCITNNWYQLLRPQFEEPFFKNLCEFLDKEYATKTIYPKPENVFNSINHIKYDDVKVVILGQDPYHEPNQAHGLAFSVESGVELPPSLKNIFKEIKAEFGFQNTNGNLMCWERQGVLLLNSVLTVQRGRANSHKGLGWEIITQKIVDLLSARSQPVVFMLWGASAQKIGANVDQSKHLVLKCAHPSPLSAYNGFFGCNHFKKANEFLERMGKQPIDWHT